MRGATDVEPVILTFSVLPQPTNTADNATTSTSAIAKILIILVFDFISFFSFLSALFYALILVPVARSIPPNPANTL